MNRIEQYRQRVSSTKEAFISALHNPREHQERLLAQCLKENQDTLFGKEHGFSRIKSIEDYRKAVPIRDYDALSPWIDRVVKGEKNVLTAEDPVLFFTSSGSTGDSKKIPVTRTFMKTCFFPFYYAAWANFVEHFPEVIERDDSTLNLKHDPVPINRRVSGRPGLGVSQVDFGAFFGEELAAEPGTRAPWSGLPEELMDRDHLEKAYCRLRLAVENDQLRCVIGINPAMVAAMPYQLSRWWPRIVQELRDGTVGGVRWGDANPRRAKEIESLAEYFGGLLPLHVWPRMQLIFCWNTGLSSLYLPRVQESFGPQVQILPAPVAASEGAVGLAIDRHPTAGPLVVSCTVLEFLDAQQELRADSQMVGFEALEEGREYHVVLTQAGGLYRYSLGDVVRVVDFVHGIPRVEYAGRHGLSSVAGERLRESTIVRALGSSLKTLGLSIHNATCHVASSSPPHYELAIAPSSPIAESERRALETAFDRELCRLGADYGKARTQGRLGDLVVHLVDPHAFFREWERRVQQGIRPPQVKDRVFQKDEEAWNRLLGRGGKNT